MSHVNGIKVTREYSFDMFCYCIAHCHSVHGREEHAVEESGYESGELESRVRNHGSTYTSGVDGVFS